MNLHEPKREKNNHNRYCGPAVLSFVSGWSTGDTARLIRKLTSRTRIMGTFPHEVKKAYNALGYHMYLFETFPAKQRPTLAAWLRQTVKTRTPGRVFLIIAGNHWQLVTGRRYACGRIGKIVSIKDKRIKRRARVEKVYELDVMPNQKDLEKYARNIVDTDRESKKSNNKSYQRVHALSKKHGIEVEVDRYPGGSISIYTYAPQHICDLREEGVIHYESVGYSWDEAYSNVSDIVDLLEEYKQQKAA